MVKSSRHIPIRKCVSCGAKRNKKDLIRLVLDVDNNVIKDYSGSLPGRGAYVCSAVSCIERISTNKRLNKIFRVGKTVYVSNDVGKL